MVAVAAALGIMILVVLAEWLHARRIRRIARLAFGPRGKPSLLAKIAPFTRVIAIGALTWGLVTLLLLEPKVHKVQEMSEKDYRHLVLVLDVSPSMRLSDAGPTNTQSRTRRAGDVLKSFFERVPMELYRTSIVAVYTEAKPVVVNTTDLEVVRNILDELPMQFAFKTGPTDLFAGLAEAAKLASPWRAKSTTIMIVSDGDTVPPTGMPKMPISVAHILVVGIGDPVSGRFIEGHQSRQDATTLRQLAARLHGTYHNGNEKHLPTDLLKEISQVKAKGLFERLTRREYALFASAMGAALLALLPFLLHSFGTRWHPGHSPAQGSKELETLQSASV